MGRHLASVGSGADRRRRHGNEGGAKCEISGQTETSGQTEISVGSGPTLGGEKAASAAVRRPGSEIRDRSGRTESGEKAATAAARRRGSAANARGRPRARAAEVGRLVRASPANVSGATPPDGRLSRGVSNAASRAASGASGRPSGGRTRAERHPTAGPELPWVGWIGQSRRPTFVSSGRPAPMPPT